MTYFKAHNVAGFMSGLGKKKVVFDLEEFKSKDIICIIGDNATGKSTFLSLVHPMHTPSDDRNKFIIQGKEGELVRIYEGDDGTEITTKCVYHPKEDTHMARCYLSLKRPGEKEGVEMNPNGNVTSYTSLLYTYFGINKDYVSFASYSDAVAGIVTMTDGERKSSVASMIPNTARFELAYSTINDKYKDLRNMIRNVSQKILCLHDEETLTSDLKKVSKQLRDAEADKDEYLKKIAKAEGRVKELSHGESPKKLMTQYDNILNSMMLYDSNLQDLKKRLHKCYDVLGLTYDPNGVGHEGSDKLARNITKYTQKIASSEAEIHTSKDRADRLKAELFQIDRDISENESVLFSLQSQDMDELIETRDNLIREVNQLEYSKHQEAYADMSYQEVVNFSKTVALMDRMIIALYEEYGELVSVYFDEVAHRKVSELNVVQDDIERLSAVIETKSQKRDEVYRSLIEKQQYRKFQDILDQRPRSCHIDSCPFIANALKFSHISEEIAELEKLYHELGVDITNSTEVVNQTWKKVAVRTASESLLEQMSISESLLRKYFDATISEVCEAVSKGTWGEILDILQLKKIAVVLSEKDLYLKITQVQLPEIEHAIELAKLYGSNRELVHNQIKRLKRQREVIVDEIDTHQMSYTASSKMVKVYEYKLEKFKEIQKMLDQYQTIANEEMRVRQEASTRKNEIDTIRELIEKCDRYESRLNDAEDTIRELTPIRQQIQMDIRTLLALSEEKLKIEHDFLVVEVLRAIAQPGKGIRKELIRLYMYDIFQTANQLLLNTFNGKLYLKEFIITDKEFVIPYVYNGSEGSDIAYASSSQQSTISMALSLAIISKLIDRYGVVAIDEADRALSAENKAIFVDILTKQMKYIGISQAFVITHSPEYYESSGEVGFLAFPGAKFHKKGTDYIEVG